jgi:LmbE family N-acetylglucosaminyl deacetylase
MPDGNVFADEEAVKMTIALLKEINPEIVFLHWPIDKPDHAAASAMAMMALSKAGMMYDREIYFFEVGKLDYFISQIYIDITPVWNIKRELVHFHERFNDDRFKEMAEESAVYHGRSNQCKYAEGFIPLHPFSIAKFNQKAKCSLFDINP